MRNICCAAFLKNRTQKREFINDSLARLSHVIVPHVNNKPRGRTFGRETQRANKSASAYNLYIEDGAQGRGVAGCCHLNGRQTPSTETADLRAPCVNEMTSFPAAKTDMLMLSICSAFVREICALLTYNSSRVPRVLLKSG